MIGLSDFGGFKVKEIIEKKWVRDFFFPCARSLDAPCKLWRLTLGNKVNMRNAAPLAPGRHGDNDGYCHHSRHGTVIR